MPPASRRAFSLLELLIGIGILGLLLAILLPVVEGARGAARTVSCLGNLRQIGQAAATYVAASDGWMPRDAFSASNAFFAPHYGKLLSPTPPDETIVTSGSRRGPRVQVDLAYCTGWLGQVKVFRCPSSPGDDRVLDYVINALDFDFVARWGIYRERPWQRMPGGADAGRTVHLAEANWNVLAPGALGQYNFYHPPDLPYYTPPNPRAGQPTPSPRVAPAGDRRHGGKANALFFDGHVETRAVNMYGDWPLSCLNPHAAGG